jgi:sugar phosphate isomerase/epimerase
MRIALLVNESSGQGTDADAIEAELRSAGAEVVSLPAERTQDVARHDPERVVIASGDGNVASAAEAAGAIGVPLAVVPSGTANDFARRMRLPSETADGSTWPGSATGPSSTPPPPASRRPPRTGPRYSSRSSAGPPTSRARCGRR